MKSNSSANDSRGLYAFVFGIRRSMAWVWRYQTGGHVTETGFTCFPIEVFTRNILRRLGTHHPTFLSNNPSIRYGTVRWPEAGDTCGVCIHIILLPATLAMYLASKQIGHQEGPFDEGTMVGRRRLIRCSLPLSLSLCFSFFFLALVRGL